MYSNLHTVKTELQDELFSSVIPFWQKHSIDQEDGGYFNCLDAEGNVFDTTKYMWLHGRQVWMFSKLYNLHDHDEEWLKIARHGMDFMENNAVMDNGRVYFSLNKKGEPVYLQRKIFTECFYALALSEFGKATENSADIEEARQMVSQIWTMIKDPALTGRPEYPGERGFSSLAVPMIMLNVIEEVYGEAFQEVQHEIEWCIRAIKSHCKDGIVYENVLKNGNIHDSVQGRLLNPGHAIEAGWFLLHWAKLLNDNSLVDFAGTAIHTMFDIGWDNKFGGLYYFLDAKNNPPVQLEWNMKLWWPHCESLYAFLLLYSITNENEDLEKFFKVKEYCFNHFSDRENGEWYGYLNRDGSVSSSLKGGPYKGCFHVPRSLFYCLNILNKTS